VASTIDGSTVAPTTVMKITTLTTVGLAVTVFVGLTLSVPVHGAQGQNRDSRARQYGGSLDARQHGYEHAYRDGADRGRQDRERRVAYSLRDNDYLAGARGYETAFGDKTQYMQGYREGYKAGYDDGFNGSAGQYSQLYSRPQAGGRAPAPDPYADRPYSSTDMAFDAGYREGVTIAQQDRTRNTRSNYRNSGSYRNADLGYRASYGDRNAYKTQFRDGLERGYEDGYGRVQDYTTNDPALSSNSPNRGQVMSGGARNGQQTQGGRYAQQSSGGTFTVPANRQWTPTGIRVNQGDLLRFTSTGEIHFTGNPSDRAGVAGSPDHKFVSTAPLPTALAGALIGRIDNGLPFGIGDSTSITAPASGLLYLGTNDDIVNDNSGQFQVVIASGR
jgi:hypothetical protein